MYRTIADFAEDWKQESSSTISIFKCLTDTSLSQKVSAEGRSLGFLAWHIVLTLGEMGSKGGFKVNGPAEDAPMPASASHILDAYETAASSLAEDVAKNWNDASLNDEIPMYGETWKRSAVLLSLIRHEAHHRAQMTVLMRQAGLKVPGIYGPSREEWGQFGMQAPQ